MFYKIQNDSNSLVVHSKERLNLEPKDWRKDLRNDVVSAIRDLETNNKFLKAELTTNVYEFFDVENILFYNIGTSNFKKLDTNGVWFSLKRDSRLQDYKYIHEYKLVDSISNDKANVIAEWENIVIDKPTTTKKPLDYWYPFKISKNVKVHKRNHTGEFGMYIEIIKPQSDSLNIINIQKPMLDGIISAFHEVYPADSFITAYIASKTNSTVESVSNIINCNDTCLPIRDVIQKYREGIKWNPQDEKCVESKIVIKKSNDENYLLSGYLYEI